MSFDDRAFRQKVIVMTGGTSGFGAKALELLAQERDTRIILGARGEGRAVPAGVEVLPLDLASLQSTRAFAAEVQRRLAGDGIDVLLLNAGLHGSKAGQVSAEGYGLTFAVNHLAHYLLTRLLLPRLALCGRLVITSSNMHNPPLKRLAPKELDLSEWAHPTPGGGGTGTRGYCASKLCNLMTAQTLARQPDVEQRRIDVIAFNPGLTGGAGGGDASPLRRLAIKGLTRTLFPAIGLFVPEFNMNTPEHSGRMLADVATGRLSPPEGVYVSLVNGLPTFPAPSTLARNLKAQNRLWNESAEMVGLDDAQGMVVPRKENSR
ncbi:SDR family NAD(P)-dependent oxidoreductase [Vannielia litorea]|uniref:SDR family NAD(P)-dependent oxidoreductase n=1 Tax=Vannielia litorea TaxID=1217970 RepID=UPI001C9381C2|nr:SDR family NAD(P)-dependent oxidoreductase [Vannielia litorea]MBY6154659.1 SDR family NAD(P)-dependent oxidoreductase [Vannielia litorea]